jgi:hypothetical protein
MHSLGISSPFARLFRYPKEWLHPETMGLSGIGGGEGISDIFCSLSGTLLKKLLGLNDFLIYDSLSIRIGPWRYKSYFHIQNTSKSKMRSKRTISKGSRFQRGDYIILPYPNARLKEEY